MSNLTPGRNCDMQLKCRNSNCVNCDYFTQNGSGAILCKIVTVGIKVMTKVRFLPEVVTYIYIERERTGGTTCTESLLYI
jgi:hypothetical protein